MAKIKIKGVLDAFYIPDVRARQLKNVWLGYGGYKKADSKEIVDLGVWAGEFSQIAAITVEYEKEKKDNNREAQEDEIKRDHAEILSLPIENRAKLVGQFKLEWYMRSGLTEKEPPADIIEKAQVISLEYYKENPKIVRVDRKLFEPLLAERFGVKDIHTGGLHTVGSMI